MTTIVELMLSIRERRTVYYHRDTNRFDFFPISELELERHQEDTTGERYRERLRFDKDRNNICLPSYEEINHKELMRFFVRECVDDQEIRKQLFSILRRTEYIDAFIEKIKELNLYMSFVYAAGDVYVQIFEEWADKYGLDFSVREEKK